MSVLCIISTLVPHPTIVFSEMDYKPQIALPVRSTAPRELFKSELRLVPAPHWLLLQGQRSAEILGSLPAHPPKERGREGRDEEDESKALSVGCVFVVCM